LLSEISNLIYIYIKKQTFVDLGCGNGFLCYLLTKEGYQGLGIDIAERKIWKQFRNDGVSLKKGLILFSFHFFF